MSIELETLGRLVDTIATWHVGPLEISVMIIGVRRVWGRDDCCIRPVAGSGQQWVFADRLTLATR